MKILWFCVLKFYINFFLQLAFSAIDIINLRFIHVVKDIVHFHKVLLTRNLYT